MSKVFYKDAVGALLIFDVTNPSSLDNLKATWLEQLRSFGHEKTTLILVGNKADLEVRKVSKKDATEFAALIGVDYIEVSALTGMNVDRSFRRLAFSVASLIPEVKGHLELIGLPDGWIRSYRHITPAISNSHIDDTPELSKTDGSDDLMKNKRIDISSINPSKNLVRIQTDRSSRPVSPKSNLLSVYINYWSGEETLIEPTEVAPTGLLYEHNPHPIILERESISNNDRYSSADKNAIAMKKIDTSTGTNNNKHSKKTKGIAPDGTTNEQNETSKKCCIIL